VRILKTLNDRSIRVDPGRYMHVSRGGGHHEEQGTARAIRMHARALNLPVSTSKSIDFLPLHNTKHCTTMGSITIQQCNLCYKASDAYTLDGRCTGLFHEYSSGQEGWRNVLSTIASHNDASIGFGLIPHFLSQLLHRSQPIDFMPSCSSWNTSLGALVELIVAVCMGSAATLACISIC
jgi:hypothetical protein